LLQERPREAKCDFKPSPLIFKPIYIFKKYSVRRTVAFVRSSQEDLPIPRVVEINIKEFCGAPTPGQVFREVLIDPEGLMNLKRQTNLGQLVLYACIRTLIYSVSTTW